jgi:hypothetical protein
VKAISLWQPWATLWLLSSPDEKVFETRTWETSYRGPLLIHAAATRNQGIGAALRDRQVLAALERHGLAPSRLFYGAVIGKLNLIGCHPTESHRPSEREKSFGNWRPGGFAWKRGESPEIFTLPVLFKGQRAFFDVRGELIPARYRTKAPESERVHGR